MSVDYIDHMGSDLKECQSCGVTYCLSMFPVRNDRSGRLRPYCKVCSNNAQRARYASHKKQSPFKLRASRAKVRAKACGVPYDLTPEYLESIWTGSCPVLGIALQWSTDRLSEDAAELDRLVPELGYVIGNVSFISRKMNRLKNNASLEELLLLCAWLTIKMENIK